MEMNLGTKSKNMNASTSKREIIVSSVVGKVRK